VTRVQLEYAHTALLKNINSEQYEKFNSWHMGWGKFFARSWQVSFIVSVNDAGTAFGAAKTWDGRTWQTDQTEAGARASESQLSSSVPRTTARHGTILLSPYSAMPVSH